ncbi:MAG: glycosyltransferase [Actinomycetia bacterium]|nr:glycosyltransferase [Actinomycetes bacterium]
MKLLIVTTVSATLEAFLLPYAAYFRGRGHRVDALAARAASSDVCVQAFDHVWDAAWSRWPFSVRGLRDVRRIRRLLRAEAYDIVHVHTPVAAFLTRIAAAPLRRTGLRVVYTAHGFHFLKGQSWWKNAAYLALEKVAGRWTDRLITINDEDYLAAREHRVVPGDRLVRMHGIGVDTDVYDRTRVGASAVASIREELSLRDGDVLFLMVAEFNANKQQGLVVDALAAADARAVVGFAGDGALRERIEAYAEAAGVGERSRFLGQRSDIAALLAASAASVIFSAREGLPRSSMESLSMAVPVIGADIRGVSELLRDGCGVLVAPGDAGALARAMCWVIEHPDDATTMGERGREKMTGDYHIRRVLEAHSRLYDELMES